MTLDKIQEYKLNKFQNKYKKIRITLLFLLNKLSLGLCFNNFRNKSIQFGDKKSGYYIFSFLNIFS